LRQAMTTLIDGKGFTDDAGKTLFSYAHPLFWPPYTIIGDGRVGASRSDSRRMTRLTNAFSKKAENHAHIMAIYFMHYNFGASINP
jgi:hypothetical protein